MGVTFLTVNNKRVILLPILNYISIRLKKTNMAEPDIMTWFPKASDYEVQEIVAPNETYHEKLLRLISTIEVAQKHIQNVIDGDITIEEKIYGTLDINADLEELTKLHKELEADQESANWADDMKKAKIGLINVKAHLNQVDCEQFATFLKNTFLFKVGSNEGFAPWLTENEKRIDNKEIKPATYDEAMDYEQASCAFLKEIVQGNKLMKRVKDAAEGVEKHNIAVQDELSKLSERYYVLCKKADARVKNIQTLLVEWKKLDEILEGNLPWPPKKPGDMDDLQVKQFVVFLRTYASFFS